MKYSGVRSKIGGESQTKQTPRLPLPLCLLPIIMISSTFALQQDTLKRLALGAILFGGLTFPGLVYIGQELPHGSFLLLKGKS